MNSERDLPTEPPGLISRLINYCRMVIEVSRASDWWEYKLPVFLGVAYFIAYMANVSFSKLWILLPTLVLAVVSAASYVSVINDITDEQDDVAAGKSNRMVDRSTSFKVISVSICIILGVIAAWLLATSWLTLSLFIANWIAYTAYSVRPLRLKKRGFTGVIADAGGGQLLPTLWTASFIFDHAPSTFNHSILIPLGIWAGALGIRGILTHQSIDLENDKKANVRTLAVRIGVRKVRKLVTFLILPTEILALLYLLTKAESSFVWTFFVLYLFFSWQMYKWLKIKLVAVLPSESFRFFLFKYYIAFFPASVILSLATKNLLALILLPLHAIMFPDSWKRFYSHFKAIKQRRYVFRDSKATTF